MIMPSFTAERSLYRTSAHYRGTPMIGGFDQAANAIQPQQGCDRTRLQACLADCSEFEGDQRQVARCRGACYRRWGNCPPPPPPPSPCFGRGTWVSGPFGCPSCCVDLGGDLAQCSSPLCSPGAPECPSGWTWVSGPSYCPTCCRDLGGGQLQCTGPECRQ